MSEDDLDEYLDDPIRLFDCEQNRVFFTPMRKEVSINKPGDTVDRGYDKHRTDHDEALYSYKNNSSIVPVTFFDIDSNVELLKQCRPLSIKLIDCDKYPMYSKNVIDLTNDIDLDLKENNLQEADCMEILSSDENEYLDSILTRIISKHMTDKQLTTSCFESEHTLTEKHREQKIRKIDEINNFHKNNNIDFKKNKGIIGLKISQSNVTVDARSCKSIASDIYNQRNIEETYVDTIDTYARLIDKSYQKLQNFEVPANSKHKKDNQSYTEAYKHSKENQIVKNSKLYESYKLDKTKSKSCTKNDCIKIKSNESQVLLESITDKNEVTQNFSNNIKESLPSEIILIQSGSQISDKDKMKKVIVEKSQLNNTTLEKNYGSCSPLLPCPPHTSKSNNARNIKIISDNPFPLNTKQNIKKNNVCKKHLFSSNRVIPHYHNEVMQTTRKLKSPKVSQKSTEKNKTPPKDIERVTYRQNDFNHYNKSSINECNENKQNLANNNNNVRYHIQQNNSKIPESHVFMKKGVTRFHLNQDADAFKYNSSEEKSRQLEVNIANEVAQTLHGSKGNKNDPLISAANSIPFVLDKKLQRTSQTNETVPTFPIQRIISNLGHYHPGDTVATPHCPNTMPPTCQFFSQYNNYSNYLNNNVYRSNNNICCKKHHEQMHAKSYGLRSLAPSSSSVPVQPKSPSIPTTIDRLSQLQINNNQIRNANIKNYHANTNENRLGINNVDKNITLMGDKNVSKVSKQKMLLATDSYINETSKTIQSTKNNVKIQAKQYPLQNLNKHLVEIPSKINKSNVKNIETNQRMGHNNIDAMNYKHNIYNNTNENTNHVNLNKNITLQNDRYTSNINKERMLAALLATDYIYQTSNKTGNNTNKVGKESSSYVNKHPHLKQYLEQLPLKLNTPEPQNTKSNERINQMNNNFDINKSVKKNYSPPILPIPTYQKTFEILARVKLYDLERVSIQSETNNGIVKSPSSQNLRKRKMTDTEKISRKISISEYIKRRSNKNGINLEAYNANN